MATTGFLMAVGPGFGGDGGFWWVDSNGHIHHVDPWGPEVMREVSAAATLVSVAQTVRNPEISRQLTGMAEKLLAPHMGEIGKHAQKAAG